jgi:hypothetical protein
MIWAFKARGCEVCGVKPVIPGREHLGGELPMEQFHCHHRDPSTKPGRNGQVTNIGGRGLDAHGAGSCADMLETLTELEVLCHTHHKECSRPEVVASAQMYIDWDSMMFTEGPTTGKQTTLNWNGNG